MIANRAKSHYHWAPFSLLLFFAVAGHAFADQLELQNGDIISGKILSLNSNVVVIQNETLGKLNIPREKIRSFSAGEAVRPAPPIAAITNQVAKPPTPGRTNATQSLASSISQLRTNSGVVAEVEKQYLEGATPEVRAKYHELTTGLASGTLDMAGLRREAKSAADQLRELKKDGGDTTGMLDAYLGILDSFLNETAAEEAKTPKKTPVAPAPQAHPAPRPALPR